MRPGKSRPVQAIETHYAGRIFRSRLEARWATFFDALQIPWDYEREGYELPSGRYLPDFWLPELDCWVEIKGQEPTPREARLATELCAALDTEVFLFFGSIFLPRGREPCAPPGLNYRYLRRRRDHHDFWYWAECPVCALVAPALDGRAGLIGCECCEDESFNTFVADTPSLVRAYHKALSARFEFI